MTDEGLNEEGAEEQIEDLEAPAEAQGEVAGGIMCKLPSNSPCGPLTWCKDTKQNCTAPTCKYTMVAVQ